MRTLFLIHPLRVIISIMPYITTDSLKTALNKLHATADHLLKIWWVLKQMGMEIGKSVDITTSSPTPALHLLFDYGSPDNSFFVPFAHTDRYKTMKADAARSIIQTNIRRWLSSGSVVSVDPTEYLAIDEQPSGILQVKPKRNYPTGLGFGKSGFALEENTRVTIPDVAFAVWYYRQTELATSDMTHDALRRKLASDLHLSAAEMELVLVPDTTWTPTLHTEPLTNAQVYQVVTQSIAQPPKTAFIVQQTFEQHITKVRSMVTLTTGPEWLTLDPRQRLQQLVTDGAKAILLYGPPRTSKTYAIDALILRNAAERETIQIHNGWGYDDLMIGLKPENDTWSYKLGPLLTAIRNGKTYIVLEEINRTEFSQAIGEIFSLLEEAYRGPANSIRLRSGENFFIPENVLIICTMNTLDHSTEDIDDAIFGRMAAVEFLPRVEDLHNMLDANGVSSEISEKVRELFAMIQQYYPLGHGYFALFKSTTNPIEYYVTRIRPVLQKHLQNYRDDDLRVIDAKVNQLFGS